jgi:hypothetical protein
MRDARLFMDPDLSLNPLPIAFPPGDGMIAGTIARSAGHRPAEPLSAIIQREPRKYFGPIQFLRSDYARRRFSRNRRFRCLKFRPGLRIYRNRWFNDAFRKATDLPLRIRKRHLPTK